MSSNRSLQLVAMLLLGGWAAMTSLIGIVDVAGSFRNWQVLHDQAHFGPSLPFFFDGAVFVLWIMSWNLLLPALVVGVIQTARVHRQVWTPLAYAAVVITGPVAAVFFNDLRNGGDGPGFDAGLVSWDTLGGLGFCAIAAATMLTAWQLLRNVGTVDPVPHPVPAARY